MPSSLPVKLSWNDMPSSLPVKLSWSDIPSGLFKNKNLAILPLISFLSVLVLAYSVFQSNLRSRFETFAALRKRFYDLRLQDGYAKAWDQERFEAPQPIQGTAAVEALHESIRKKGRYWLNAFDEWYITHYKGWNRTFPILRSFSIYAPLWHDYYESAFKTTANKPSMTVTLWSYANKPSAPTADPVFVEDMWKLVDQKAQEAVLKELIAINGMFRNAEPDNKEVMQVAVPHFLKLPDELKPLWTAEQSRIASHRSLPVQTTARQQHGPPPP